MEHGLDGSTGTAYSNVYPQEISNGDRSSQVGRCVRGTLVSLRVALRSQGILAGDGVDDRREWLENRLKELADIFAVPVGGFSMMENHLHVLLRLDPEVGQAWSDSVYIDLNPVAAEVAQTPETMRIRRSSSGWTMSRQKARLPSCRPPRGEASPVRKRRPVWKSLFGSVRSKTVAGWIRDAKA